MAKSFKQLPTRNEPAKRTSEKDVLDFLEQDRLPASLLETTAENTSSTGNNSNISNTSSIRVNTVTEVTNVTESEAFDKDVRQTFVLGQQYLDRLKDYVHTRRMQGQYEYTQKQALHDALDKLFKDFEIEARPLHIRQQEESRKQRIRKGITK